MNLFLAALDPKSFWNADSGSQELTIRLILTLVVGFGLMFLMTKLPTTMRKPIVWTVTFLSGLFYMLVFLYPAPINRQAGDAPRNAIESFGFTIADSVAVVANISNILAAFLLGLGIYSLFRIHSRRIFKFQKDWFFSLVLLTGLITIVIFGYLDFFSRQGTNGSKLEDPANWAFVNYGKDLFFEGLLQSMDAAMFSVIAFFILSAAYRAFRIRSVEATILLVTALVVMLSLMGAVEFLWGQGINSLAHNEPGSFVQNFTLTSIAGWIRETLQTPSIRGIDFGIGIGLLAMGLRVWLGYERTAGN